MRRFCTVLWLGSAAIVAAGLDNPASAERIVVPPNQADLQKVLDRTVDGDVVVLQGGEHRGPLQIARRIILEGEPGATVVGSHKGSVIVVSAPDAVVRGLAVRDSGLDAERMDAGVFIEQTAARAVVDGNRIEGNLYGVYIHGAPDAIVSRNEIVGIAQGRMNDAGNGVSVWNAPGAKVLANTIRYGRDGIFSIASRKNTFSGNRFRDLRFAVHYMYTNDSEISDNISTDNTAGYAIMFSHRLTIRGNVSDGDRDRGFLFNFANGSLIEGNTVRGHVQPPERWARAGSHGKEDAGHGLTKEPASGAVLGTGGRIGPEKCVFIYNTNQNRFRRNWLEGCEIGVHFTAGSEGNEIIDNAFVRNRSQVKYVSTRHVDWSRNGRGNYWSDNPAFDLDGDAIGDTAYRPNDLVDRVLWTAPQAKVLMNSPAVQVIRWAQAQFPAIFPGGVIDSHPLMTPSVQPKPTSGGRP